jgi:hypothetical protein
MLFRSISEASALFARQKSRFPASHPDNVSSRPDAQLSKALVVQTTCHTVWTHIKLKASSVRTTWFSVWTLLYIEKLRTAPACICSDVSATRPDALFHKASIAIQIQPSGRACIRYGNCMHQISRPDDHPSGLDARSLYMEITCSGRTTVRATMLHRPDAAFKQERSSTKFSEFRSHSCPPGRPMTIVRMAPVFIKAVAHLNP